MMASLPLIKSSYEQWVFDLLTLLQQPTNTIPRNFDDDSVNPYPTKWLIYTIIPKAYNRGLLTTPITPGRTLYQEGWAHFVTGIKHMYEIPTFREAASKAKQVCQETPLATDPLQLWKDLPRTKREEMDALHAPSNIKESWLAEKLEDAEKAAAAAKDAEYMEWRRRNYYYKTLQPEMKRLYNIFSADITYAMAPTTDPKEKIRNFLKHDGVIREYNELVHHMRTLPYSLKNYVPAYEKNIGDELDKITLNRLSTLEKPKRRKRLSVAAKVRYAKEWRKLNMGYHRDASIWGLYCIHLRPTYLKHVTINNMTPAKMRLLRRVYSKGV